MDTSWTAIIPVLFLIAFIVAGFVFSRTRSARDRLAEMSRRFKEGGMVALQESYYVTEVVNVPGVLDWAAHLIQERQVNVGVRDENGVVYNATNFLDIPFSESVREIFRDELVKGVRGVFTLARVRRDPKHPSLLEYVIVDFDAA